MCEQLEITAIKHHISLLCIGINILKKLNFILDFIQTLKLIMKSIILKKRETNEIREQNSVCNGYYKVSELTEVLQGEHCRPPLV